MATTEKRTLRVFREDPETGKSNREELNYFVALPTGFDPAQSYGVVFCVAGFGDTADSAEQMNELRPRIADKYNVLAVGVRYHNDARINGRYDINLIDIGRYFGLGDDLMGMQGNWDSVANKIFELMSANKVHRLPVYLAPKTGAYHQYSSFGFLPALEHLDVFYDLSKQYRVDKKNIVAMGSGYGGYVASLMGKFAPFTFSAIIDVSGYCFTEWGEVFGGTVGRAGIGLSREIDGSQYVIPIVTDTIWSVDEMATFYFSDAHRQIRNLLNQSHRITSPTFHCHYHSTDDNVVPIEMKDKLCHILDKYNPVYYQRVKKEDIDGELFSNMSHGMGASLEKIFDLSMEKYREAPMNKENDTDFDRDVTYGFPCSDKLYNFTYTGVGLDVQIKPIYL
ncbi:MAG: DUF2920 family protein [Peptococcaceae bacterium]|nr:DUF2920 family protein [Peptococcaceae bacterium]